MIGKSVTRKCGEDILGWNFGTDTEYEDICDPHICSPKCTHYSGAFSDQLVEMICSVDQ